MTSASADSARGADHTARLLKATPPTVAGRSLSTDRPLAAMVVFDFAALIDAANDTAMSATLITSDTGF